MRELLNGGHGLFAVLFRSLYFGWIKGNTIQRKSGKNYKKEKKQK